MYDQDLEANVLEIEVFHDAPLELLVKEDVCCRKMHDDDGEILNMICPRLNYCPWCGATIRFVNTEKKEED